MIQIFAPPTDPLQYRAVGLMNGRYTPGVAINKGTFHTEDGLKLRAYINPSIIHFVRKDEAATETVATWTVYPRTLKLPPYLAVELRHIRRSRNPAEEAAIQRTINHFSIRGQVVDYVENANGSRSFAVEIRRNPQEGEQLDPGKQRDRPIYLTVFGQLKDVAIGQFWAMRVHREKTRLWIDNATLIDVLPLPAPRPKLKRDTKEVVAKKLKPQKSKSKPVLLKEKAAQTKPKRVSKPLGKDTVPV